jgi:hypothetical protein
MGGRCLCSSNRPTVFGLSGWDVEACLAAAGQHIPSHHSRVPLIVLLLLIPPATAVSCVFLLVHCTTLLLHLHTNAKSYASLALRVLNSLKSRRSNTLTHTTLLRKTVGAPRPLLEQLRKRSARSTFCSALPLTPPSAHTPY